MSKKPRGLGAGFASLLGDKLALAPEQANVDELTEISVAALTAGRFQPRSQWDESSLLELAESIKSQGVVQPIVVRPLSGGLYEIIAGERRWRASKMAGLSHIPAVVRQMDDQSALAVALIENIQREELTAIEEARAIRHLTDGFALTHEQVAQVIGRSRESVSNLLRLLKLEVSVQESVLDGQISAGHARALIPLSEEEQKLLAQKTISLQWSVRELEKAVRLLQQSKQVEENSLLPTVTELYTPWEKALQERFGQSVKLVVGAKGKGKLEIAFANPEVMQAMFDKLGVAL